MKKHLFLLIALLWSAISIPAEAAPPAVTAQKVAKMADDYLKERGLLNSTYIVSITLETTELFGAPKHWFVKWDKPLPVEGSKQKEIGLKISFDGKLVRLVD
jgi:hypothetical protein